MNKRLEKVLRLGEKVRYLRTRDGMSQSELAHALGYTSRGYISDIENGKKLPTAEAIVGLANHFKVTTDYLLRDEIVIKETTTVN